MKKCEQMRFVRVVRFLKTLVGMARKRSWRSHRQPCFITMFTECLWITIDFSGITVFFFWIPSIAARGAIGVAPYASAFQRGRLRYRLGAVLVVFQTNDSVIYSPF